jgi:hypothetical protein
MKNLFPIMLIILGCSNIDNSYPELSKINLRKYIGKEVSIFFNDFNKQYDEYYFLEWPLNKLRGCMFYFEEYYIQIIILPDDIPERGLMADWELDHFLERKIRYIEIVEWPHGDNLAKILMKSYRWKGRNRG